MKPALPVLGVMVLAAWLASGVLAVGPDEVAVVTRLGAVDRTVDAGLGYRLPWPLERDERVAVTAARRAEPGARRLLTGDTNLVDLELAVQFAVSDAVAFLTGPAEPERLVTDQVLSAATGLVSTLEVEGLLTTGRTALALGIERDAQARLDALSVGIAITSVEVLSLGPPPAVVDAFNDVSSARGDQETLALSAEGYRSEVLPSARGQAARRTEEARARASERIARAQAEVLRFESLARAHTDAPGATRLELQQWSLERIGGRVEVVVAQPGAEVVLPAPWVQEGP